MKAMAPTTYDAWCRAKRQREHQAAVLGNISEAAILATAAAALAALLCL